MITTSDLKVLFDWKGIKCSDRGGNVAGQRKRWSEVKNNEPVKCNEWTKADKEELACLGEEITAEDASKGRAKKQKLKDPVEEYGADNLKQKIDALEKPPQAEAAMISQEIQWQQSVSQFFKF